MPILREWDGVILDRGKLTLCGPAFVEFEVPPVMPVWFPR